MHVALTIAAVLGGSPFLCPIDGMGPSPETGVLMLGAQGGAGSVARYTDCYDETPDADMTFWAIDQATCSPSVKHVNNAPEINSVEMTQVFEYNGLDATVSAWPAWGAGPDLDIVAAGTDVTPDLASPLYGDSKDEMVQLAGSAQDYYQADNGSSSDLTTFDLTALILLKPRIGAGAEVIVAKRTTVAGYEFGMDTSDRLYATLHDGTDTATTVTGALEDDHAYLCAFRADKSSATGAAWYCNGVASGAAVDISLVGSLTNAQKLTVGALSDGSGGNTSRVGYLGMWACDACLTDSTFESWVEDTTAAVFGTKAIYAAAAGSAVPAVSLSSRRSAVLVTTGEVHKSGANWMHVSDKGIDAPFIDTGGNVQLLLQTEDLGTSWTTTNVTVNTDAAVAPDGRTTADALQGDVTDGVHCVLQLVAATSTVVTLSVFAKPGARDWGYIAAGNAAGDWNAYFNASTCAAGTTAGTNRADLALYDLGDWCWVNFAMTGAFAADNVYLCGAAADTDNTYVGSGVDDIYYWGPNYTRQIVGFSGYYVSGTTSTTTVTNEMLHYDGAGNFPSGATRYQSGFQSHIDTVFEVDKRWFGASNGAAVTDLIAFRGSVFNSFSMRVTAASVLEMALADSLGAFDGDPHTLCVHYQALQTDNEFCVDGTSCGSDAIVAEPVGLSTVGVVGLANVSEGAGGWVGPVKIYNDLGCSP